MITTVDIDPLDVTGAWELPGLGFGAELASSAELRTINLGFGDRPGDKIPIAGADRHVTRFEVCRHCGAARDARESPNGATKPEKLHEGWCEVRSGSVAQRWDKVVLYHQLTTEAVRVLVPISMFQHEERLASFKGALLLGLRHDIGGDPDHLEIARSDLPNRHGDGRRRFLALYDRVPGGTGYLARLAEPERVRQILEGARDLLLHCPCVDDGRTACHRCLLGVVDRTEYDLVRRDIAVDILNGLLADWAPEQVTTVSEIDIGRVEESELERRFKVALQDWAAGPARQGVQLLPQPGKKGNDAFELRLTDPLTGTSAHWRLDEQEEGLGTSPNTVPDFYFRRLDARSPDVAVYLDGFQFHAAMENRHAMAGDATKRSAVRDLGHLVWNLTWEDVKDFHSAVTAEPARMAAERPLLAKRAKNTARSRHSGERRRLDASTLDANPMAQLLAYLRHPAVDDWEDLALSAIYGAFATAPHTNVARQPLPTLARISTNNDEDGPEGGTSPDAKSGEYVTEYGLSLQLLLDLADPEAERWHALVLLPDDEAAVATEDHHLRWRDWLQWANLLQFLRTVGRYAVIATTTSSDDGDLTDMWRAGWATAGAKPVSSTNGTGVAIRVPTPSAAKMSVELVESLEYVDDDVRELIEAVFGTLSRGSSELVIGHEEGDGIPIEAAWPAQRIGIQPDELDLPAIAGWDIRAPGDWTIRELSDLLEGSR